MSTNLSYSFPSPLLLRILIKDVGIKVKIFEAYISVCILGRAIKLSIQALQQYITLPKNT